MVVFEALFIESKGKPVEYNGQIIQMTDEIPIGANARICIEFLQANSKWRQGISLTTEGTFKVGGQQIKRGLALWQDTAPASIEMFVASKSGKLQIKNIWDVGDGVIHSWHNGAAMIVTSDGERRQYRCNDGQADDDFDDLIFTITVAKACHS